MENGMKNCQTDKRKTITGGLLIACITVLGVVVTSTLPRAAQIGSQSQAVDAANISVPPLPPDLEEVPPPHEVVFVGHAIGTQNYVCLPSGSGVAWTLFTPQATLFSKNGRQLTTHFFSPNPEEDGTTIRAAWQHSRDSSTVWGRVTDSSSDANFVAPGAIAWLTLETAGVQEGLTGSDQMTEITFIQRLNTVGGSAPATGCSVATDVGTKAFVPYRADYFFFEDPTRHGRTDGR
jgi:Protein of unknown function (DUF3455)